MKTVTSITTWNDAVGKRISITYSEIDENTGKIIADNRRIDRVITDRNIKDLIDNLMDTAQDFVDEN
jgi:hypothetical protein